MQLVQSRGTTVSTMIDAGVQEIQTSGSAYGTIINSGGAQDVAETNALATGTVVRSAGTLDIYSGGTAIAAGIASGGTAIVGDPGPGIASNTTISGGGILIVSSGGTADPTRILSRGTELVGSGGTDLSAQISGGVQTVSGFAKAVMVSAGGVQTVETVGFASGTIVKAGAPSCCSPAAR